MTLHRLSAGAGYAYLLKTTVSGDCERSGGDTLTSYYAAQGSPPGRWLGRGLGGLDAGMGVPVGARVEELAMTRLFGRGCDPVSGAALGRVYPSYSTARERIAARVAVLPDQMTAAARAGAVEDITRVELARVQPGAVAGFDMTFTPPKSVSTLWGLSGPEHREAVLAAHRAAVAQALDLFERRALFTRTGQGGCQQRPTRGMLAAAFDHWDSRAGDPNLHTHVVVANKVQTADGRWLSIDSRALHHAVVSISEVYDDFLADELARRLPVRWSWRDRGSRRSPAFELDGVDDGLMAEFSTRTTQIDEAMTAVVGDFHAAHGRGPNRIEISRLRQQVTRSTRPAKRMRSLSELVTEWRRRAMDLTDRSPEEVTGAVLQRSDLCAVTAPGVPQEAVNRLAAHVLDHVMERRSTWTRWNVLAEAARATRGVRMASPADREALLDRVSDAVMARCVSLEAPDLFAAAPEYQRPDGTSLFSRPGEARFTHEDVLAAEQRLLTATHTCTGPRAPTRVGEPARVHRADGRVVDLAADQADAVLSVAGSGRRVDVLVGPAGTGKTTTLAALKEVWEAAYGPGSVVGLAPSATAAAELAEALRAPCENTAKWMYESTGSGAMRRTALIQHLSVERRSGHTTAGTLRSIDVAIARLTCEQHRWVLRPGQLVIVDEASLAGTRTLDALTQQATRAGAKLLLVGDHAQLSAVDAGGAFHLLAQRGRPAVLTSLWRFSNAWEARASRALRAGDRRVIETYAEHGRVSAGAAEAMCELAYTTWQGDTQRGVPSILLAADARTVAVLNARAHNDRVTDGLVSRHGVATASGPVIGVGDRIITRANDRRLKTHTGYVRNGDLWTVTALGHDGSATVTRVTGHAGTTEGTVVLPARYVAEHVDLGYATTTHRAQGVTVDHAHVLAAPGMVRENLYVAMTRGRHHNHVYVAVDEVDPACENVPDVHSTPDGSEVLAAILATSGAELSATETIAANQDTAASLMRLYPIRRTILADASSRRWTAGLRRAGMSPEDLRRVLTSPSAGSLFTALEQAATVTDQTDVVLGNLVPTASAGAPQPDDGDDLAAVLSRRVRQWLATQTEDPRSLSVAPDPSYLSVQAQATLREVDVLIAERITALTDQAITAQPGWLRELGPEPTDLHQRRAWRQQIAAAVAHQDASSAPHVSPALFMTATGQVLSSTAEHEGLTR